MKKDLSTIPMTLLTMSLQACIIYYLNNLQKIGCECAINYKQRYIFGYAIFSLLLGFSNLFTDKVRKFAEKTPAILILLLGASILNIVFTLLYIDEVKKANCDCSESVFRDMMFVLSIIQACAYGFLFLSAVFVALALSRMVK